MAEHYVSYNGIIYIIPNDELYQKYENDEAFIDAYGRLVDSKSKRVIKELKPKGNRRPIIQRKVVMVQPPEEHPIRDATKQAVADVVYDSIHKGVDWAFDVGIPYLWREHIVPLCHQAKEILTTKELKVDAIPPQSKKNTEVADVAVKRTRTGVKMTQEESDAEKRKALYHWLGLLSSLKKLHDDGEIDVDSALTQLTDPIMLERVNALLSENPNLLEMDKYIELHGLLGRDLYEKRQLIPIEAAEITTIAEAGGYDPRNDKMEDKHNG